MSGICRHRLDIVSNISHDTNISLPSNPPNAHTVPTGSLPVLDFLLRSVLLLSAPVVARRLCVDGERTENRPLVGVIVFFQLIPLSFFGLYQDESPDQLLFIIRNLGLGRLVELSGELEIDLLGLVVDAESAFSCKPEIFSSIGRGLLVNIREFLSKGLESDLEFSLSVKV